MALKLFDTLPDFIQYSNVGSLNFYSWVGNDWAVILSFPKECWPNCTTDLKAFAEREHEFGERGIKVVAFSSDPDSLEHWAIAEREGGAFRFSADCKR